MKSTPDPLKEKKQAFIERLRGLIIEAAKVWNVDVDHADRHNFYSLLGGHIMAYLRMWQARGDEGYRLDFNGKDKCEEAMIIAFNLVALPEINTFAEKPTQKNVILSELVKWSMNTALEQFTGPVKSKKNPNSSISTKPTAAAA